MPSTLQVPVPSLGVVTVVFGARRAKLLGYGDPSNQCLTPNGHTVCVEADWISLDTFIHECGHTVDATRLGWRYVPWVLMHYALHGYDGSVPERRAEAWKAAHRDLFAGFPNYLYAGMKL